MPSQLYETWPRRVFAVRWNGNNLSAVTEFLDENLGANRWGPFRIPDTTTNALMFLVDNEPCEVDPGDWIIIVPGDTEVNVLPHIAFAIAYPITVSND